MKKGIVKANMITLKKGGYLHKDKIVGENDVNGFDKLVEKGSIEIVKAEKPKEVKKEETKTVKSTK